MPTIEQDIVGWVKKQRAWQRNLLKRIARGDIIDEVYVANLAEQIVANKVTLETPELTEADVPTASGTSATTMLESIGELQHVNALLSNQTLVFGIAGVTVVYGDNGSGKSGYARLAKEIIGARHREPVLRDAYSAGSGAQSAKIVYSVGGDQTTANWPNVIDPALSQAHFYDEACGNDYLERETELAYRPSALSVLDRLIKHVDEVRAAVQGLLAANESKRLIGPSLAAGTKAAAFLNGLTAKTTQTQIDDALALPVEAEQQLADLVKEEARLKTTDQGKEKSRLIAGADSVLKLADHLDALDELVGPDAANNLAKLQDEVKKLRQAATDASKTSFSGEPLNGVGSESWRLLWGAAERYSQVEAYPETDFPATATTDYCVLCQQPVGSDARDRLQRFHQFVHNDVESRARTAEKGFADAVEKLKDLEVTTSDLTAAVAFIGDEDKKLSDTLQTALAQAQAAKEHIGKRLRGETEEAWVVLITVDTAVLRQRSEEIKAKANGIDEAAFKKTLVDTSEKRAEFDALTTLAKQKGPIEKEVVRRKEEAAIRETLGKISTQAVTKESTDLSRKYVTEVVMDHFVRESERLKLEHVVLGDKGGTKGRIRHQPTLLGASGSTPRQVLSKGEQTAAGLAGFFTEVSFDDTKSVVVLDDPVSSLDHDRREQVAHRITELAKDRQVIVFTHDLIFLGNLVRKSSNEGVALTERTIERNGTKKPGVVRDKYPWKAKAVDDRLGELTNALQSIKSKQASMTGDEYEEAASAWAGKLSETWERTVRTDVVGQVVDRGTTEVRPKMMKLLAKINNTDNSEFQTGYSATSTWSRRHDKSEEKNYTAPTVDEMEVELKRIKDWRKRVKGYAN